MDERQWKHLIAVIGSSRGTDVLDLRDTNSYRAHPVISGEYLTGLATTPKALMQLISVLIYQLK